VPCAFIPHLEFLPPIPPLAIFPKKAETMARQISENRQAAYYLCIVVKNANSPLQ
jgi:hypothetical protein